MLPGLSVRHHFLLQISRANHMGLRHEARRDGKSIAATLTAPEGESVRVRLDRLRHDTASILVGRTTGEEWLNGASLFLKRPLSSNFLCGSRNSASGAT